MRDILVEIIDSKPFSSLKWYDIQKRGLLGLYHVINDKLRAINNQHFSSRNYVDNSVSIKVYGNIEEKIFQHEDIFKCFIKEFYYGAKKYGYWSYKHLIIQLEDCIDEKKGIYGNNFILKFMVEHSCGHDRQREYGKKCKYN